MIRRPYGSFFKGLIRVISVFVALNALSPVAFAFSAATGAMAGAEVAIAPDGVPINPAAVAEVPRMSLQAGMGLPFGAGPEGYAAFYEPKDTRGVGAAFSGMLGITRERTANGYDNVNDSILYYTSTIAHYQVAEKFGNSGAVGIGVRYQRDVDGARNQTGTAWRFDLGWQGHVASRFSFGVVARDVLGTDLRWSNGSVTPRQPSWQAGAAMQLGRSGIVSVDCVSSTTGEAPTWAAGLALNPTSTVTVRGGYRYSTAQGTPSAQTTLGAGINMGDWRIDAASTIGHSATGTVGASLVF